MADNKRKIQRPVSKPIPPPRSYKDIKDNVDVPMLPEAQEAMKWVLSIVCATFVFVCIGKIITLVYNPDIPKMLEEAKKIFYDIGGVRPEPVEALLFRLGIVFYVPSIFGFYVFFSRDKFKKLFTDKTFFLYISLILLALIVILLCCDLTAINPFGPKSKGERPQNGRDYDTSTNFEFFFEGIFMGTYAWHYVFIIVPAMCALFFIGFKSKKWDSRKLFKIIFTILGTALILFALGTIALMNTYVFPYSTENKFDFSAVYYSMTQVYGGLPMLVDGFTNTYGLYPHFLNLIFHFTGLTVHKFSMVMSTLLILSFVFNYLFLAKYVKNKVILFLGFMTVIFFPYLDFKIVTAFDSVFSLFPIRYITPSLMLCLASWYFNKRSPVLYWLTFVVIASLVLWNPELGLVSYLSWLIINVYYDFYDADGKINYKKILFHIGVATVIIVSVFYSYKLLIHAFYGVYPNMSLLFETTGYFARFGMGNLPMALIHPWNIVVLILITGFLYAFVQFYKKQITAKSTMVLAVALVSVGYFTYFQGRSQNSNFTLSSSFCLMLLTILGDDLWSIIKEKSVLLLNGLFVIFLALISFSFIEVLYNNKALIALTKQEEDKRIQLEEQVNYVSNKDFILKKTKPEEKIMVVTLKKRQAFFFGEGKRLSGFNPGYVELFTNADAKRLENTFRDSSFKVFVEQGPKLYPFLMRPVAAFSATYEFSAYNKFMGLFEKKKWVMPTGTYFRDTDQVLFHRKYTDDTAGISQRIHDALGVGPVNPKPEFSVQALFYSAFQIYDKAAIVGNLQDSAGFMICNILNSSNYYFGINDVGYAIPIPQHQWTYCVMNVYADHVMVYKDGHLLLVSPLRRPIKKSKKNLYIGNSEGFHFYVGGISEVSVANKVLDSNQVKQTWNEIQTTLKK